MSRNQLTFCKDLLKTRGAGRGNPPPIYGVGQYYLVHDGNVDAAPLRILIVGDDAGWTDVVADHLRREEMSVILADKQTHAVATAEEMQPRIIVLDLALPGVNRLELCRRLRMNFDAHIILLTTRCDDATTTTGLAAGADDVLTKSCSGRELAARIRAIGRGRGPAPPGHTVRPGFYAAPGKQVFGPLSVDVGRREVFVADEQISLTRTQFDILATLAQRADGVTTRQELLDAVWGPCWAGSPNVIDVHIGHLRRKLGDNPARPLLVLNIRGIGYRLAG